MPQLVRWDLTAYRHSASEIFGAIPFHFRGPRALEVLLGKLVRKLGVEVRPSVQGFGFWILAGFSTLSSFLRK